MLTHSISLLYLNPKEQRQACSYASFNILGSNSKEHKVFLQGLICSITVLHWTVRSVITKVLLFYVEIRTFETVLHIFVKCYGVCRGEGHGMFRKLFLRRE